MTNEWTDISHFHVLWGWQWWQTMISVPPGVDNDDSQQYRLMNAGPTGCRDSSSSYVATPHDDGLPTLGLRSEMAEWRVVRWSSITWSNHSKQTLGQNQRLITWPFNMADVFRVDTFPLQSAGSAVDPRSGA